MEAASLATEHLSDSERRFVFVALTRTW